MATIATSSIQDNFLIPISGPVYSPVLYNTLSSWSTKETSTTDFTNLTRYSILPGVIYSLGSDLVLSNLTPIVNSVGSSIPIQEVGFRTYNTFVGGSAYLNGNSGIYVQDPGSLYTVSSNTTIEFWMRTTTLPEAGAVIGLLSKRSDTGISPANWITLAITDSGLLQLQVSSTSVAPGWALTLTGTKSISAGTWYHIAITKSSNDWIIYLNGKQYALGTSSGIVRDTASTLTIGAYASNGSNAFTGYITGFRYVVGTVVYTSDFTLPNYAPTASATDNQDAIPSNAILINNTDLLINPIYGSSILIDTSNISNTNITGTYTISALSPLETLYSTKVNQNITPGTNSVVGYSFYGLGGTIAVAAGTVELWI